MANRICCTALTGRIMMGRTNSAGNAFVGQKLDVTSDVLKAVIDKAAFHGGSFEIAAGEEKWDVTVTKAGAAPAAAAAPADVDALAQEIRRVDGSHSLGAGALAEALMPFIANLTLRSRAAAPTQEAEDAARLDLLASAPSGTIRLDFDVVPIYVPWGDGLADVRKGIDKVLAAIDAARARQEGGAA